MVYVQFEALHSTVHVVELHKRREPLMQLLHKTPTGGIDVVVHEDHVELSRLLTEGDFLTSIVQTKLSLGESLTAPMQQALL